MAKYAKLRKREQLLPPTTYSARPHGHDLHRDFAHRARHSLDGLPDPAAHYA
jgi:hypothetical protein